MDTVVLRNGYLKIKRERKTTPDWEKYFALNQRFVNQYGSMNQKEKNSLWSEIILLRNQVINPRSIANQQEKKNE